MIIIGSLNTYNTLLAHRNHFYLTNSKLRKMTIFSDHNIFWCPVEIFLIRKCLITPWMYLKWHYLIIWTYFFNKIKNHNFFEFVGLFVSLWPQNAWYVFRTVPGCHIYHILPNHIENANFRVSLKFFQVLNFLCPFDLILAGKASLAP